MKPTFYFAAALAATTLFFSASQSLRAQCNIAGATTNNTCFGIPNGEVDIAISAGTWSYDWNYGPNSQDRTDLYNDVNYSVTATCLSGQCSQYCTTVTYSFSITSANSDDWPQSSGDLGSAITDDGVVATLSDDEENVYFLGTFKVSTFIGGDLIETNTSADYTGMWFAKFDQCGDLVWVDYSDLNEDINIRPVDFNLVDGSIYVFGSIDVAGNEFKLDGTNISTPLPIIDMATGHESFLLKVAADDGDYEDYESISTIEYTDELYDMEFFDDDFYVAGEASNAATVHQLDMTGYSGVYVDNGGSGNSWFTDIEWDGSVMFGVGTFDDEIDFGNLGGQPTTGLSDAFAMSFDGGTSYDQGYANVVSMTRAEATGLEIDENGEMIIIGNYDSSMVYWGGITTSKPNFFLLNLPTPSSQNPNYTVDGNEPTMQSVKAIDVAFNEDEEVIVLGSFVGSDIQFDVSASSPNTSPGDDPNNALWIGKFENSVGDNIWVTSNWSDNSEAISPVALADGPYSYFATGTYLDDINTNNNSPKAMDGDLVHPDAGKNAVFMIRYGDFQNILSSGQVYKTENPGDDGRTRNEDLKQVTDENGFGAFPNPGSDQLHITWPPSDFGNIRISLTTINGQSVYSEGGIASDRGSYTIDVGSLASGVYLLHLNTADDAWQQKIIVQ